MAVQKSGLARFPRIDDSSKQRLITANYGEFGSGKTTWCLGAPGPIVVQSFDRGLEGVVENFAKDKEIYVVEYELMNPDGTELDKERGSEVRDQFIADYEHAIKNARTIIWDRETDVFDTFKYAETGSTGADGGLTSDGWDKLKGRIRRLINMAKATEVNFHLIQGMRNEWTSKVNPGNGKKGITQTGNRVRKGMEETPGLVHLDIEHVRVPGTNGEPSKFVLNIGKSRGPGSRLVQDQQFEGLSWVEFACLVFPDSDESSWT